MSTYHSFALFVHYISLDTRIYDRVNLPAGNYSRAISLTRAVLAITRMAISICTPLALMMHSRNQHERSQIARSRRALRRVVVTIP